MNTNLVNNFERKLTLKKLLIFIQLFIFLTIFFSFTILGSSVLFDDISMFITICFTVCVIISLIIADKNTFPIISIIGSFLFLFYFPRLIFYIVLPKNIILPFHKKLTADEINNGLIYITFGYVSIVAGIIFFDKFFKKIKTKSQITLKIPRYENNFSKKSILNVFFIIIAIDIFLNIYLAVNPYAGLNFGTYHKLIMVFRTLTGNDTIFFISFGIFFYDYYENKKSLKSLIIICIIYWLDTILSGSKSGILRINQILLIIYVSKYNIKKIKIKYIGLIFLILAIMGPLTFYVSTSIRYIHIFKKSFISNFQEISNDIDNYVIEIDNNRMSSNVPEAIIPFIKIFFPIIDRLGTIDYTLYVLNLNRNDENVKYYLNFSYLSKSILNILLPGNPFHEARFNTSRIMPILFNNKDENYLDLPSSFNTNPWSSWGISYIYFGKIGGLFFLFIIFGFFQLLYLIIKEYSQSDILISLILFLTAVTFIGAMGLDTWITLLIFLIIQILVIFLLLIFSNLFINIRKNN